MVGTALHWRLLQLADSGFPMGSFAHSAGLEAAAHLGQIESVEKLVAYVEASLWNVGNASLPLVAGGYDAPAAVWELDERLDAFITSHVANRASRTQGRAFVTTCARIFDEPPIAILAARVRTREVSSHLAPLFGASLAALGLLRTETLGLHLYLALRGLTSAAIRLGLVGPQKAQQIQVAAGPILDAILRRCAHLTPDDAATIAPIIDLVGTTHDALYARIFQS